MRWDHRLYRKDGRLEPASNVAFTNSGWPSHTDSCMKNNDMFLYRMTCVLLCMLSEWLLYENSCSTSECPPFSLEHHLFSSHAEEPLHGGRLLQERIPQCPAGALQPHTGRTLSHFHKHPYHLLITTCICFTPGFHLKVYICFCLHVQKADFSFLTVGAHRTDAQSLPEETADCLWKLSIMTVDSPSLCQEMLPASGDKVIPIVS